MGLDMYLYCNSKEIVDEVWKDESHGFWRIVDGQCCYWRKANQIHKWFVDNVQHGADDCGVHEVSVGQLEELLETVQKVLDSTKLVDGRVMNGYINLRENWQDGKVLEDESVARELLPTQEGFFFGGTRYDQWYWDDLEYTRDKLTTIIGMLHKVEYLAFGDDSSITFSDWMLKGKTDFAVKFYYHSSW